MVFEGNPRVRRRAAADRLRQVRRGVRRAGFRCETARGGSGRRCSEAFAPTGRPCRGGGRSVRAAHARPRHPGAGVGNFAEVAGPRREVRGEIIRTVLEGQGPGGGVTVVERAAAIRASRRGSRPWPAKAGVTVRHGAIERFDVSAYRSRHRPARADGTNAWDRTTMVWSRPRPAARPDWVTPTPTTPPPG